MRKILLATYGSYGDLHPYLAMARVLRDNGDAVTIVTHAEYQEHVERIGVRFVPMKPGLGEIGPQETWSSKANHSVFGTQFIIETLILPYLEDSYHAIKSAAVDHDLIISHVLCFAVPLVSEKLGIPWVSVALQPAVFFSAYDPPALGFLTFLPRMKFLGPKFMHWFMHWMAYPTRRWLTPLDDFRRRLQLAPVAKNVLVDSFSPHGNLVLFSSTFVPPQPDWPEKNIQVGFPLFDEETTSELSPELEVFLAAGSPPIVFTLGTAIVMMETSYFETAYQAAKLLGMRAVFLVGKKPNRIPAAAMTDSQIHISTYEPFSKLFPRAAIVVHQCGVGTSAQALASGRPQLLVPFAHDQPDNARRIVELGCGLSIPASRLNTKRLMQALKSISGTQLFTDNATKIAHEIRKTDFQVQLLAAVAKYQSTFGS